MNHQPRSFRPDAAPAAFAWHENQTSPRGAELARFLGRISGAPIALDDAVIAQHGRAMDKGDPLGDSYVEAAFFGPGKAGRNGRTLVEQALEHGLGAIPDASPELARLMRHIEATPPWLDWDKLEHGAEVFRRYGTDAFHFFGASTIEGYRVGTVAKPLVLTGAYTGGSAFGRFLETARFWVDVSEPGALRPGGVGRRTAVTVRVMHSLIRRKLLAHREWDRAALGVPISQADSFGTLLLSSFGLGQQLKLIGYCPSDADIAAMMHHWRYIGYLMGVEPEWYPETVKDGFAALYLVALSGRADAGEDGVRLAQSYVEAWRPREGTRGIARLAGEINYRAKLGYTRFYINGASFRACRLPAPGLWRWLPVLQFPGQFALEQARRLSPAVARWIDRRNRRRRDRWLARHLAGRAVRFQPVEALSR